ncbi:MAG: N-acetylmuramoyl-L-alanine amidase [Planctomycetota bacterium]|nr:MAG: N-acetylmuramoyl-L-alanine amidase [Planctomycetota bacterium]
MKWRRGKVSERAFNKVFAVCGYLLVLGGCIYNDEPMPTITRQYPDFVQPAPPAPTKSRTDVYDNVSREWLPSSYVEKKWTAMVIHHSGTGNGNAAIFDKWHREGKHWAGVGYDFIIGNGSDSGDGQVEATYRWRQQRTGAHCGGTPGNWANKQAIGICLVGDFNVTAPTGRQMQSLVRLLRFLQRRYNIPKSRIYGHGSTPGYTGKTKCPGKRFPMTRLKSTLDF